MKRRGTRLSLLGRTLLVGGVLFLSGCVERALFIRSEPPGARVFIDGEEAGTTPVTVSFDHYGTREVMLRHRGHESVVHRLALRPPWYQWFPLDLVVENLWPLTVQDHRTIDTVLRPTDPQRLRARLEELRERSRGERGPRAARPAAPRDGQR